MTVSGGLLVRKLKAITGHVCYLRLMSRAVSVPVYILLKLF